MRTVMEILVILLLVAALYYYYTELNSTKSEYQSKIQELRDDIDSLNSEVISSNRKISQYEDSLVFLDSALSKEKSEIDSIKTVYVKKRIPAIDSFTVDSLINYFRSRYRKDSSS